jgi:hypothetical protein
MDLLNFHFSIHFLILFSFFSLVASYENKVCFPTPTPYYFGSLSGDTTIKAFTYSYGDFFIGGSIAKGGMSVSCTTCPYAARINSGGTDYMWAKVVDGVTATSVTELTYNKYVAIALDTYPMTIILLDSLSGLSLFILKDSSTVTGSNASPL